MLRLQHHDNPLRMQLLYEGVGNLRGQAFLHLRALRVHVHQTRQLRKSADTPVGSRDVRNMGHAEKRHQVMLAYRIERDIAHEHHFLMVLVKRRHKVFRRVLRKPREHLLVHLRHTFGCFEKPFPIGVFPHPFQDKPHALFYFRPVHVSRPSFCKLRFHLSCKFCRLFATFAAAPFTTRAAFFRDACYRLFAGTALLANSNLQITPYQSSSSPTGQ